MEIQLWAKGYDLVAVQEADPLFREALGPELQEYLVQGDNDRDARGVVVESASAALLPPGVKEVCREEVVLQLKRQRGPRGKVVSRSFVVFLLERESDGERLVFSSVHLHVPSQIQSWGIDYVEYLEPLRRAVMTLASPEGNTDRLMTPVLLAGDFNIDPEDFMSITNCDPVWNQLQPVQVNGGCTAHPTNPCERGDFALSSGGQWTGRALGPADHSPYERFAKSYTKALSRNISLDRVREALLSAKGSCGQVFGGVHKVMAAVQKASTALNQELHRNARVQHKKGLLTSDHRPISFVGHLSGNANSARDGV